MELDLRGISAFWESFKNSETETGFCDHLTRRDAVSREFENELGLSWSGELLGVRFPSPLRLGHPVCLGGAADSKRQRLRDREWNHFDRLFTRREPCPSPCSCHILPLSLGVCDPDKS